MTAKAKLLAARRSFLAFVRDDPVTVDILRAARTATAGGGKQLQAPASINKLQQCRLVPAGSRHGQVANTDQSQVESYDQVLVGATTLDVQKDDVFQAGGNWFRVVTVDPDRELRTAAGVVEHGPPG